MMSIMSRKSFDANNHLKISGLGQRVMGGESISREEALWLFHLEDTADIYDLMSWANRIREHFKGNRVHLCSIVNVKSGGCSENCRFCSQSAAYETTAPRYGLVEKEMVLRAADETRSNGVTALGLVAAWRGIDEGPVLDEICEGLQALKRSGKARPDASLGIVRSQRVAERLKESGLECYNHNLETSRRFFPKVCSTHTYEERVQTINHMKHAGVSICSGGILGMGESIEDRCDLAFSLRELEVDFVPINILNPIDGTPFATLSPLPPIQVPAVDRLFPFHSASTGNHGGGRAGSELARSSGNDLYGGRERAHGWQLSDHAQSTRGERPSDAQGLGARSELEKRSAVRFGGTVCSK